MCFLLFDKKWENKIAVVYAKNILTTPSMGERQIGQPPLSSLIRFPLIVTTPMKHASL
jgi:hypothetical protein